MSETVETKLFVEIPVSPPCGVVVYMWSHNGMRRRVTIVLYSAVHVSSAGPGGLCGEVSSEGGVECLACVWVVQQQRQTARAGPCAASAV